MRVTLTVNIDDNQPPPAWLVTLARNAERLGVGIATERKPAKPAPTKGGTK